MPAQGAVQRASWAILLTGGIAFAQQPPIFHERVNISLVSFLITANTLHLRPEEVEVQLDGAAATVLELEPVFVNLNQRSSGVDLSESGGGHDEAHTVSSHNGQVLFVVSNYQCSRFCLTAGAEFLAKNADRLVALGPVTMVLARYSGPEVLHPATKDPASLKSFAERELLRLVSRSDLVAERRWLSEQIWGPWSSSASRRSGVPTILNSLLRESLAVREVLAQVREALAQGDPAKPRLVFLLSDGFGLEGYEVWDRFAYGSKGLDVFPWEAAARQWEGVEAGRSNYLSFRGFTRELAADGVMIFPVFPGFAGVFAPGWSASFGGRTVFREFMSVGYSQGSVGSGLAVEDPTQGLKLLAEETGGRMVPAGEPFAVQSSYPYLVTCQVGALPDGQLHQLAVRRVAGQGEIWAPKFVRYGTSVTFLEARAKRLLRGEEDKGKLLVSVTLNNQQGSGKRLRGTLTATVDFSTILGTLTRIAVAKIRVLVAVDLGKEIFLHRAEFSEPVAKTPGSLWTLNAPLEFPSEARKLAVVVEELHTGAWGAAVVDVQGQAKR